MIVSARAVSGSSPSSARPSPPIANPASSFQPAPTPCRADPVALNCRGRSSVRRRSGIVAPAALRKLDHPVTPAGQRLAVVGGENEGRAGSGLLLVEELEQMPARGRIESRERLVDQHDP